MSSAPSFLFKFYETTRNVFETYGPFRFLDDSDIANSGSDFIWTVVEADDGSHLVNGKLAGSSVDCYLLASKSLPSAPHTVDVFMSHITDCLDCTEDECEVCDGEGIVLVDFADPIAFELIEFNKDENLWQSRTGL